MSGAELQEVGAREIRIVDIRGQVCPSTLLTALQEINANRQVLRSGRLVLEFLTDNRDATVTIPDAAQAMGYAATVVAGPGEYRISVTLSPSESLLL